MPNLPPMPTGCAIESRDDFDGLTLSWRMPAGRGPRLLVAAFMAFWLCGWLLGEIWVGKELLAGKATFSDLVWLGFWTLGGCAAVFTLWVMLRPIRPESVTLGEETFHHDPGSFFWQVSASDGGVVLAPVPPSPARMLFPRPLVAARADLGKFVLDRVGERQRLSVDLGADRIEVGAGLREPEREWLFVVLDGWQRG